jgi:hypothetical protein
MALRPQTPSLTSKKATKPTASRSVKDRHPPSVPKQRNFPVHSLEEALVVAQKINDEMGGRKPFKRLLLAEALGIKPSSSNFRELLSSSYKYGLTEGTEKAPEIALTQLGARATQNSSPTDRVQALRVAAMAPEVFKRFYTDYRDRKLPSADMFPKILESEYSVAANRARECAGLLQENGRFAQLIRDIGGSPHVLIDAEVETAVEEAAAVEREDPAAPSTSRDGNGHVPLEEHPPLLPPAAAKPAQPKPIFIGHGKNKTPLQKLQAVLTTFRIPHKATIEEANLGRPISQKVKDTMDQCGSAILIFTRDEKFFDEAGQEIWRPSENVVHELGAASYAYGDRIMIFKEKGLHFPTNFQNVGYIEFEPENLESKTTDLLKELIGFGLVRITPA